MRTAQQRARRQPRRSCESAFPCPMQTCPSWLWSPASHIKRSVTVQAAAEGAAKQNSGNVALVTRLTHHKFGHSLYEGLAKQACRLGAPQSAWLMVAADACQPLSSSCRRATTGTAPPSQACEASRRTVPCRECGI